MENLMVLYHFIKNKSCFVQTANMAEREGKFRAEKPDLNPVH